jgi:hypothetical protein
VFLLLEQQLQGFFSSALLIGNQTGITPIISSTSSYILSGSGVNKIDLNAGTITSGTSSSYSYLISLVVVLH